MKQNNKVEKIIKEVEMRQNIKTICFDVDDVLLNTQDRIIQKVKELYGDELKISEIDSWDFYERKYPKIIDFFASAELYDENNKAISGMDFILQASLERYDIKLVTSTHPNAREAKEKLLRKYFSHVPGFLNVPIHHVELKKQSDKAKKHSKRELCENSILIDDAIHNIEEALLNSNTYCILVDFGYGWNKKDISSYSRTIRATCPSDILRCIIGFENCF